jgi:hypothetical protein
MRLSDPHIEERKLEQCINKNQQQENKVKEVGGPLMLTISWGLFLFHGIE